LLVEIDQELKASMAKPPYLVVVPVGVGSLAHAVVIHYKRQCSPAAILAVEPDTAACLRKSLVSGKRESITTGDTIMTGLNCGTTSSTAWPVLHNGIDLCVSISDFQAHCAVKELSALGVRAGPCGAAGLAALRTLTKHEATALEFRDDSTIVLLNTEGERPYSIPIDVESEDPVILSQALVRLDSSNPELSCTEGSGEKKVAEYVAAWFEHRDFEVHRLESNPGRPSIVAVARGTGNGKSLMFNGHIDTVSLSSYDGDPLKAEIVNGSLYGRGAFDMKSGVAAAMVAAHNAKKAGLAGDVIVTAVADEEYMSKGTEEVLLAGWRADAVICCEPSHLQVTVAHGGFVWYDVEIVGQAGHGSRPDICIDAIVKAGHFLLSLGEYSKKLSTQTAGPLVLPPSAHASLIKGGEEPSSYPASCSITIERRMVPGETKEQVDAEIRGILDDLVNSVKDFKYILRQSCYRPPFRIDPDQQLIKLFQAQAAEVLGKPPVLRGEPFWTDCALFAEQGIPAMIFGVDGGGAHAAKEWAVVESIRKCTEILTKFAVAFCT
jgi:acetylornithine deacetylase/succinyl-diaminopimelate desuccinylase family protein